MKTPGESAETRAAAASARQWPAWLSDRGEPLPRSIRAWIGQAEGLLESRLESDLLASFVLGKPRSWLYAHDDR
ncbi:MAG: hypothetical protein LC637_14310, partial [Xanthomonadaceae bacterium]|nr:hypothetical protein [Xanthomonadaceae bacterium]